MVEPGDLRLSQPLRSNLAFVFYLKKDYVKAEQIMQENLQLSLQMQNFGQTSGIFYDLGRLALATQRIKLAEEYFLKSINILGEHGQFVDLSVNHLYLGKCYFAQQNLPAAHDQFLQVIKSSHQLDNRPITYWGLVNLAMIYLEEGQTGMALEISLATRLYPIEFVRMKEDGDLLQADLLARLPQWQVEAVTQQVNSRFSPDPAGANALAYAVERVMESSSSPSEPD